MRFDPYLSLHDFYLHIACKRVIEIFGAVTVAADGSSMLHDDLPSDCPTIQGYRPDAVVACPGGAFMVEVKSEDDFGSQHSRKQYRIINRLLAQKLELALYLFVFNSSTANQIPTEFSEQVRDRVVLEQV